MVPNSKAEVGEAPGSQIQGQAPSPQQEPPQLLGAEGKLPALPDPGGSSRDPVGRGSCRRYPPGRHVLLSETAGAGEDRKSPERQREVMDPRKNSREQEESKECDRRRKGETEKKGGREKKTGGGVWEFKERKGGVGVWELPGGVGLENTGKSHGNVGQSTGSDSRSVSAPGSFPQLKPSGFIQIPAAGAFPSPSAVSQT